MKAVKIEDNLQHEVESHFELSERSEMDINKYSSLVLVIEKLQEELRRSNSLVLKLSNSLESVLRRESEMKISLTAELEATRHQLQLYEANENINTSNDSCTKKINASLFETKDSNKICREFKAQMKEKMKSEMLLMQKQIKEFKCTLIAETNNALQKMHIKLKEIHSKNIELK